MSFDPTTLFSVKGKRALVTGGGSGLGSYIATALAEGGATVYIVGRREEKLKEVVEAFGESHDHSAAPSSALRLCRPALTSFARCKAPASKASSSREFSCISAGGRH